VTDEAGEAGRWLIDVIAGALRANGAEDVAGLIARQQKERIASLPRSIPACRFLPECAAASMFEAPDVAAALAGAEEFLHWKQNPNYSDAVLGEGHMANYAYAELIGPSGFFAGDDFLLGLMILGPHRHYRDHYHPAPELYWLLTGPSEWRRGDSAFIEAPAGAIVRHAPVEVHATRTGDAPLLAVWAWLENVAEPARLAGV
jgi:hypothetical protein